MERRLARQWGVLWVAVALVLGIAVGPASPAAAVASLGKAVDGWRPADGSIYAMARVGDRIILGGDFTELVNASGQPVKRSGLAAIGASSGALLGWAPNPNGPVRAITGSTDGRTVYVGGIFSRIAGAARTNLAAVDATTGSVKGFSIAAPNGGVRTLLLSSGSLYLGGTFWKIGTTERGGGAAVDPTTGRLRAWNPATNNGIYAMVPSPDRSGMVIGGPFRKVHGVARDYLAKVDATSGALANWTWSTKCDMKVDQRCNVLALTADAGSVYVGIDGPGGRVESVNPANGSPRWAVTTDGDVQTVAVLGDTLYIGGHFTTRVGTETRSALAAIDIATAKVQAEPAFVVKGIKKPDVPSAEANGGIWSVLADHGVLRIGGYFLSVDGAPIGRYTTFGMTDQTAPTQPGAPVPVTVLSTSVQLSWTAAKDDLGGAVQYRIYRDGDRIATSTTATYVDAKVSAGKSYSYTVTAVDAAGNESRPSGITKVATPARGLKAVGVRATRAGYGNVLSVDVNPDQGRNAYRFTVQKLGTNRQWSNLGSYVTLGATETRAITLPKGTYRVYVLAGNGYAPAVSSAVVLTAPTAKTLLGTDRKKNKLKVNVNPDKGKGFWSLRVQKRNANGTWTTLSKTYKTKGNAETRTVNLKKGTYRVVVSGKYGFLGSASNTVVLVK